MRMKTIMAVLSVCALALPAVAISANRGDVPVRDSRGPLTLNKRAWAMEALRKEGYDSVPEGRNILLDKDSWPRRPGRILAGPSLEPGEGGVWISFALDSPDDIWLYAADPESGEALHTIACGVLGPNAPEPLAKNTLKQRVFWDGEDLDGRQIADKAEIRLSVGCEPTFERFIGYDPTQLMGYPLNVEVDARGRVYVAVGAHWRAEAAILRFDREGNYLDMVHPANPKNADYETMKKWYPYTELTDGEPIPLTVKAYGNPHFFRWAGYVQLPFRIGPQGEGWIMHGNLAGWQFSLMHQRPVRRDYLMQIADLDHFFAMPFMPFIIGHMAGWALDGKGHAYFGMKATERPHKSNGRVYADPNAVGTVYKVDLKTGELAGVFTHHGNRKLDSPSPYLGESQWVPGNRHWDYLRTEPDPEVDSDRRFVDICGLEVDAADNIYVADGYPRRVKMYRQDGSWIGELTDVNIEGRTVPFFDIVSIRTGVDALYVLAILRDEKIGAAGPAFDRDRLGQVRNAATHLIKFTGQAGHLEQSWVVKLAPEARCVAVDRWAPEPIVWVGAGNGTATISRIVDHGTTCSRPEQIGGVAPEGTFVAPELIATDGHGNLFVYDYGLDRVIRTDEDVSRWTEIEMPNPYEGGVFWRQGIMSDNVRHAMQPSSLRVDRKHGRVLLAADRDVYLLDANVQGGFAIYDEDLEPLESPLPRGGSTKAQWHAVDLRSHWRNRGQMHITVDREGNIYACDTNPQSTVREGHFRANSWTMSAGKLYGMVSVYSPEGEVLDTMRAQTFFPAGPMAVDSRGGIYIMDLVRAEYEDIGIWFPDEVDYVGDLTKQYDAVKQGGSWQLPPRESWVRFKRGGKPVYAQSDICYLVKFPKQGGVRNTADELWAHRGIGPHYGSQCYCSGPGDTVVVDGADRIIACDGPRRWIKVFDSAGNLIARFGRWGNAETVPGLNGFEQLGFFQVHSMDAAGDRLYVVDRSLRRIARFTMGYRQTVVAERE
jgi:hypothetical protein